MYRSSPFRSSLNTGYITGLDMCKVCTEAVHCVALWTRVTLQVWTCVKYVPKQSIFFPSHLFAAIGLRSGSCFTGQLPGIGTVFMGSGGSLRKEVMEGWGMVGWVLEKEAGCEGCHCCVCEKSCPSGPECPEFWSGRGWWWKRRLPHSSGLPLRCLRRQGGTSNCEGVRGRPVLWLCVHRWVLLRQSDLLAVGVHLRGWVGRLEWCRLPIELHPRVPSRWQWLRCADHRCVGHRRWGLPVGCGWWPVHRLRGTLWLLRVQVGLHGYEVLLTGHRLRGGRLGSRKCDGTGRFVQTVEGAVEVDGGEGSGKGGMGMRSRWCKGWLWRLGSQKGRIGRWRALGWLVGWRWKVLPLNVHEPWWRLCVATLWRRVLLLVLVAGRVLGFGWRLWQPMWEVPILLRLRFVQRPLRLGAPEVLESGCWVVQGSGGWTRASGLGGQGECRPMTTSRRGLRELLLTWGLGRLVWGAGALWPRMWLMSVVCNKDWRQAPIAVSWASAKSLVLSGAHIRNK